jgi:hypothetical protein
MTCPHIVGDPSLVRYAHAVGNRRLPGGIPLRQSVGEVAVLDCCTCHPVGHGGSLACKFPQRGGAEEGCKQVQQQNALF